ncbi:MAG: hypothetical protein U0359_11120 [Byssovorax sp.]
MTVEQSLPNWPMLPAALRAAADWQGVVRRMKIDVEKRPTAWSPNLLLSCRSVSGLPVW